MSFDDPRHRYYVERDTALERGDSATATKCNERASLAVRESEEWSRAAPRGSTLEGMGWRLSEPYRHYERDALVLQARKGNWRVTHLITAEAWIMAREAGALEHLRRMAVASLTAEAARWESL